MAKRIMWKIWSSIISALSITIATPVYAKKIDGNLNTTNENTNSIYLEKAKKPLLFLKQWVSDSNEYFAGHRSHSSHRSHRSHSSHRSGSYHRSHVSHTSHSSHYSGSYSSPSQSTPSKTVTPNKVTTETKEKGSSTTTSPTTKDSNYKSLQKYIIILKNGSKIETTEVYEEGSNVKVAMHGVKVLLKKDDILRIEKVDDSQN